MKEKSSIVAPTALLAELVGTFILTIVAIAGGVPLVVGFTMIVLVLVLGIVSGAHVNPAVTIGLWSIKKFEGRKVPFYILMQFAGAMAALLVIQYFQGKGLGISFGSFGEFNGKIVVAEMLGAAVFLYAVAAAVHKGLLDSAKALCIGLALMAGLYVGGGLLGQAAQSASTQPPIQGSEQPAPNRLTKIDGSIINPAIALAATEKDEQPSQLGLGGQAPAADTGRAASRLTLETIVGALVGGVVGANLYMLTAGVNVFEKKKTVKEKVTTVVKKGKKEVKKVTKKAKK